MSLTKKHMVRIAKIIRDMSATEAQRREVALNFAHFFTEESKNFDIARFIEACCPGNKEVKS